MTELGQVTQIEILQILRELVLESMKSANPAQVQELGKIQSSLEQNITPDSPLASLGWDSLQMTWLLVALEERLDIDTSRLSIFDLYSIGDLLSELETLVRERKPR